MTNWVCRQKERYNQASRLVNLLHRSLHSYESNVFLSGRELSVRCFDPVLLVVCVRIVDLLKVAVWVDVTAINY